MNRKRALITGVTGQDGSYLAELLLSKGYEVHGLRRRTSTGNTERIAHLYQDPHKKNGGLHLHYGDIADFPAIVRVLTQVQPDEIYHLAAQSHVKVSFDTPEYTANVDALGTLRLLEAVKSLGMERSVRLYQAATSELYGKVAEPIQSESTPFYPRSPYGVAKLYAYWISVNYREAYGMYICNGICFNHESPRRDPTFVTRKISSHVARVANGCQEVLYLGNLNARRDWGYAPDYVRAMWLMLQQDRCDDYVVATGETHSVREFVEEAFRVIGIEIEWEGTAQNETGKDARTGRVLVKVDPWYFRPTEVDHLQGNSRKARERLGWSPTVSFRELVALMVKADLEIESKRALLAAAKS